MSCLAGWPSQRSSSVPRPVCLALSMSCHVVRVALAARAPPLSSAEETMAALVSRLLRLRGQVSSRTDGALLVALSAADATLPRQSKGEALLVALSSADATLPRPVLSSEVSMHCRKTLLPPIEATMGAFARDADTGRLAFLAMKTMPCQSKGEALLVPSWPQLRYRGHCSLRQRRRCRNAASSHRHSSRCSSQVCAKPAATWVSTKLGL